MSNFTLNNFQTSNKRQEGGNRLPASISSLKPDCSSIDKAENSNEPKNWLFHPVGYVFNFDARKAKKTDSPYSIAEAKFENEIETVRGYSSKDIDTLRKILFKKAK